MQVNMSVIFSNVSERKFDQTEAHQRVTCSEEAALFPSQTILWHPRAYSQIGQLQYTSLSICEQNLILYIFSHFVMLTSCRLEEIIAISLISS